LEAPSAAQDDFFNAPSDRGDTPYSFKSASTGQASSEGGALAKGSRKTQYPSYSGLGLLALSDDLALRGKLIVLPASFAKSSSATVTPRSFLSVSGRVGSQVARWLQEWNLQGDFSAESCPRWFPEVASSWLK